MARNGTRWALAALAGLTLLRLVVGSITPLVPDEAYYWVWSRALAPGYPDHPPMVAFWVRVGTFVAGDSALGVRLLGPLSVAIGSLLLADAGDRLFPGRYTGIRAAGLLNATLMFGVGTVLMTPDTPLLAFWIASIWAISRLLDSGNQWWWLVVGLFAGLAMASKYTAALLWLGIALWVVATPAMRSSLKRPAPWLGALLALAIFLPVIWWEAEHGWPSFNRQGGRLADWQPSRAIDYLAELIGGQIGLITPLVFVFLVAGVVEAARWTWRTRDPAWALLTALTLPPTVLFLQHALGDRVQGNWPAIVYPAAAIAAGALRGLFWRRLWGPALGLGFGMTLLVYLQAGAHLLPLPAGRDPIARELAGWETLADKIDEVRRQAGADFVAAEQYGLAAELARGLPRDVPVVGTGSRLPLLDLPAARLAGNTGILVQNTGRGADDRAWQSATKIGSVKRQRGAEPVESFELYRVVGSGDSAGTVALPRPR